MLTTLRLEIDLDDTLPNGKKLDTNRLYEIINTAASEEYERQVEANRIKFQMRMTSAPHGEVLQLDSFDEVDDDHRHSSEG